MYIANSYELEFSSPSLKKKHHFKDVKTFQFINFRKFCQSNTEINLDRYKKIYREIFMA